MSSTQSSVCADRRTAGRGVVHPGGEFLHRGKIGRIDLRIAHLHHVRAVRGAGDVGGRIATALHSQPPGGTAVQAVIFDLLAQVLPGLQVDHHLRIPRGGVRGSAVQIEVVGVAADLDVGLQLPVSPTPVRDPRTQTRSWRYASRFCVPATSRE